MEVTGIDAAKKLVIIKEVKTLLNLGLKEAKDLVEKLPATIKQGISSEEAEEFKKKLESIGCQVKIS